MKIVKEESGLSMFNVASYGDVFLNGNELEQLIKFLKNDPMDISINDQTQELETLRSIVQNLEQVLSKLKDEHQKDIEALTQRLRAAHFFDLRTSLGVMDRLVNNRDSVALTPKSNQ